MGIVVLKIDVETAQQSVGDTDGAFIFYVLASNFKSVIIFSQTESCA
jgi:hypothetical protein